MSKYVKSKIHLFLTALFQVTFVAANVTFIAKALMVPMIITGFMISLIWTLNVKKVAFGDWWDRVTYASGAALGTWVGFVASHLIIKIL